MALPSIIPLFPLPNVVLFPQVSVPLHVFEPRYLKMVRDALEERRIIGMILLRPGWESNYYGRPPLYSVGCAGSLEEYETLDQGRFNIRLKGISRFRLIEEHDGEPYRVASIEPLADHTDDDVSALDTARERLINTVAQAAGTPAVAVTQDELPHDIFLNTLCYSLALTAVEKQSLLDCDGLLERYARLQEILEFRLLEQTYRHGAETHVH